MAASAGTDGEDEAGSEFDAKEAAAREQAALQQAVAALRAEKSALREEVEKLMKRYDALKVQLAQLEFEDDVEKERAEGIRHMDAARQRLRAIEFGLEEAETYERTLIHMLERGQQQKLSYVATLKAFEDALRAYRSELDMQNEVLRAVTKSRDVEMHELHRLHVDAKRQL